MLNFELRGVVTRIESKEKILILDIAEHRKGLDNSDRTYFHRVLFPTIGNDSLRELKGGLVAIHGYLNQTKAHTDDKLLYGYTFNGVAVSVWDKNQKLWLGVA